MSRSPREQQIESISRVLGDRRLVWFGIRGEDAAALLALKQFRHCFGLTAPLEAGRLESNVTLEGLTGARVDLDRYDIDEDRSEQRREAIRELRWQLLAALRSDSVLATYRPSHFLSAIHFASLGTADYLGMFKDRHTAFEHKPWVEVELSQVGVPVLPWKYVSDEGRSEILHDLDRGPLILRPSRSSGGEGIALLEASGDLVRLWPERSDHIVSVAPYLSDAVPVNVGACVFADGQVNLYPASVQLIGIPQCTDRRFGYCGNDFASLKNLPLAAIDDIDKLTRRVGRWLASRGYLGAFGVDYLVEGSTVHFVELNARFQGSSALTSGLANEAGLPDPFLDHLAAHAGVEPTLTPSLSGWVTTISDAAQVLVHNHAGHVLRDVGPDQLAGLRGSIELLPTRKVVVQPGGVLGRLVYPGPVTRTGYELDELCSTDVECLRQQYAPVGLSDD